MFQYPIISRLLHPFTPLMILLGLLIVRLCWKRNLSRTERITIMVPYLLLFAMSLPAVSYLAFASLEWYYLPMEHYPEDVEAIVVLSGYADPPNRFQDYVVLGKDTLHRCLHAAALFRQGKPCLVIPSGGKVLVSQPGPTLALAMKDFLVTQGVSQDHILLEDRSRNTYESAVESGKLLRQHGIRRIVLVTDAASLLRAEKCFRRQGIDVIPLGCRYRTLGGFRLSLVAFLPSEDAVDRVSEVWHEWLGLLWYWIRGRI